MTRQNHRLHRAHTAWHAGSRRRSDRTRRSIVFLGESDELVSVYDWARRAGFVPVDIPHPDLVCAVVDEDILDGTCSSVEAGILQRVRQRGLPCLPPSHARNWLETSNESQFSAPPRIGLLS